MDIGLTQVHTKSIRSPFAVNTKIMKKLPYIILGTILLLPITISSALGIDIDTFRKQVLRPENLPVGTGSQDATAESKLSDILSFATDLILYASGGVAVFFLVVGGIRYITSLGNQERMDAAKKTIKYAVVGLLAVIFAYAIVTNVINLIFRATV